jgi:hypothetical protein
MTESGPQAGFSATPIGAGIASLDLGKEKLIAADRSKAGALGPFPVVVIISFPRGFL